MSGGGSLAVRLRQAERTLGPSIGEKRAYLARYFASSRYEGHREAIVRALCSGFPQYSFQVESDPHEGGRPTFYLVSWWNRGGGPYGKMIVLAGGAQLAAIANPPTVGVYSGEWAMNV